MKKSVRASESCDLARLRGVCQHWIDKAETDEERIIANTLSLYMSGGDPFEREKNFYRECKKLNELEDRGRHYTTSWQWEAMKRRCEGETWKAVLESTREQEVCDPTDESHLKRSLYNYFKWNLELPEKQNIKKLEEIFKQTYGRTKK
ncbi:hypothetical protein [Vibrio sonorensis]|uniref:hypothetical protein n=1 Tax=Vibrio sonorensis TaxID=1004316 RepID=UPI0008D8DD8D|nr:hypothetical protein [Vibrio sonorensis]